MFVACGLAIVALANADRIFVPGKIGTLGVTTRLAPPPHRLITSLTPDSPLAAAGAKRGDEIVFDRDGDRVRILGVDETIGVTLVSGKARSRHLEVRSRKDATVADIDRFSELEALFGSALMFALGAVVGWRRADSPAMRALAISLMSQMPFFYTKLLPGDYLSNGLSDVGLLTFVAAYAGFLFFAVTYTRDVQVKRRPWLRWTANVWYGAAVGICLEPILARHAIDVRPLDAPFAIGSSLTALAALLFAWKESTGTTRQRIGWLLCCVGAIYLVYVATVINLVVFSFDRFAPVFTAFSGVVITAANCGFAYAVLRRRVLDVEFVLNRTTVYGATSVVLAAAFILISQITNRLIHFQGREQHRWIDLAVGVVLALMGRQTARWIDPRVQRLLFRRWHASTAKLKRFGTEEMHALPTHDLEAAYLEAVREFGDATTCALYLGEAGSDFVRARASSPTASPTLAADDPLVERLRAAGSRGVVRPSADAPEAALALPLLVRGSLVGVLVLGSKTGGESYRPDEIELLAQSASHLGLELEIRRLTALEARVSDGRRAHPTADGAR